MSLPSVAKTMRVGGEVLSHLAGRLGEVVSVGLHTAPDCKVVFALRPGLILGRSARFSAEAELLGTISPNLLQNVPAGERRDVMRALATILGRVGAADRVTSSRETPDSERAFEPV